MPAPRLTATELAAIRSAAKLHAEGVKVRWRVGYRTCDVIVAGKSGRILASGSRGSFLRLAEQAEREFWAEVERLTPQKELELV